MYDINVEPTTNNAIKQNLNGIKKISKERILIELLKILDLQNFLKINESSNLREIFSMIFPEFLYSHSRYSNCISNSQLHNCR